MKKDIGDFCKKCIIDIPSDVYHEENLLTQMIHTLELPGKREHDIMLQSFSGLTVACIKKDQYNIIGQEYYFDPSFVALEKVADALDYKYSPQLKYLQFSEYSFDFQNASWELNIFDNTTAAYYVDENTIEMKNIYFGFQKHQKQELIDRMKKTLYPHTDKEISELMFWNQFQRQDGTILLGKKRNTETLYFTKLNFLGFLKFVQVFGWQKYIGKFMNDKSKFLKYYVFDVAIQYSYQDGKLEILKTSIYALI